MYNVLFFQMTGPTNHKSAAKYNSHSKNSERFIHNSSYLIPGLGNLSPNFHMGKG